MRLLFCYGSVLMVMTVVVQASEFDFANRPPLGAQRPINPESPYVQDVVTFLVGFIADHPALLNVYQPWDVPVEVEPPENVRGTEQIVSGTMYRLSFDIYARVYCPFCPDKKHLRKLYTCKSTLLSKAWVPVKYTLEELSCDSIPY